MTSISSKFAVAVACASTAVIASVMNVNPAKAAQLNFNFRQEGFIGGGTLTGSFSGQDNNSNGTVDTNEVTFFSLSFTGNSTIPPFQQSLNDLGQFTLSNLGFPTSSNLTFSTRDTPVIFNGQNVDVYVGRSSSQTTVGIELGASSVSENPLTLVRVFPLTWTLNNVTFDDGGNASGTFDYDAGTNTYFGFNISVAGGNTTLFPPFTYSPTTSFLREPLDASTLRLSSNDIVFVPIPGGGERGDRRTLFIDFEQPLTNAGGTINVQNPAGLGGDAEFNTLPDSPPFGQRRLTGGTVSASVGNPSPVPEPSSVLGTLAFGAFGTVLLLKRRLGKRSNNCSPSI